MLTVWKRNYIRDVPYLNDEIIFKRHMAEWILPYSLANHIKYNPRHVPVVQRREENEDYYLRLSIRRVLLGWTYSRSTPPRPSPFIKESLP